MRQFDADYLEDTRRGMWDDCRAALEPLSLSECEVVLDVGCGTGELTRVVLEETDGEVIGCDADPDLLAVARDRAGRGSERLPVVAGDARSLPLAEDSVDLVVCQALLINLPDPRAALEEFARVARERVAAIEPDNGAVTVESTVGAEKRLERRARQAYLAGVGTDVTLGAGARRLFAEAGLADLTTRRYDHVRTIDPPYSRPALEAARRKATGAGLDADRAEMLAGGLTEEAYAELRADWRSMGRRVIEQMGAGDYRRSETVPFFVTVGRV